MKRVYCQDCVYYRRHLVGCVHPEFMLAEHKPGSHSCIHPPMAASCYQYNYNNDCPKHTPDSVLGCLWRLIRSSL